MARYTKGQPTGPDALRRRTPDESLLQNLAPAGYYIALRLGFAFPLAEYNALPAAWVSEYTENGLMLFDPVLHWGYAHAGATRWSAMDTPDPRGVMSLAAKHGLRYGAVVVCGGEAGDPQRSIGSFARSDREITDAELALLAKMMDELHRGMATPTNLTKAELEVLRMSREGMRLKEIASTIGVSDGAIKQRLKNARGKLNARNISHAVSLAVDLGLI